MKITNKVWPNDENGDTYPIMDYNNEHYVYCVPREEGWLFVDATGAQSIDLMRNRGGGWFIVSRPTGLSDIRFPSRRAALAALRMERA